ncbi:lipoprotein signal peptidase II [Thermacetogenium phaeum DSM 12270]|uniref:Lipoprotein signal peptidase n=1 Tax=Thermacetogenium phaeum (strain ATCC BAA-254 / DSM 26808 / PB) TaxID=1089553 RepID=K4LHG5_THEPS|nr:signal peptidase II [Thermacetogenium phaeum]AFV11517.1 lipoprotein signal peptidase II [Thermacetogenium phaeum DSM 12270]
MVKKEIINLAMFITVTFAALTVDQVSKVFVVKQLRVGESLVVLPQFFHLTYIKNPGGAFGILPYRTEIFIFLAFLFIIMVLLITTFYHDNNWMLSACLGLITGGVMGNLIDRIRLGYVIDFLDFRVWPIFNAADVFITGGALLLFLLLLQSKG